jgi:hypothetical protein
MSYILMTRSGAVTCANGDGPLAYTSMVACTTSVLGSVAHVTCHSMSSGLARPGLDCRRTRSRKLYPSTVAFGALSWVPLEGASSFWATTRIFLPHFLILPPFTRRAITV